MKLTILLLIILIMIPSMLHPGEFRGVVSWKAGIAIDMTGIRTDGFTNNQIKKKSFKPRGWE